MRAATRAPGLAQRRLRPTWTRTSHHLGSEAGAASAASAPLAGFVLFDQHINDADRPAGVAGAAIVAEFHSSVARSIRHQGEPDRQISAAVPSSEEKVNSRHGRLLFAHEASRCLTCSRFRGKPT